MKKLLCLTFLLSIPAAGYGQDVNSFVELLRSDIRTQKVAIIAEAMQFEEPEAAAFWPVHREYENALGEILDGRLELIKEYAANYQSMTDEKAAELAMASLELEEARTDLKEVYFGRFSEALSPIRAARFLQIDNQLNMVIDLQIASQLPLISKPTEE